MSVERLNLIGAANLGSNIEYALDTLEPEVRGRELAIISHAGGNMDQAAQKAEAALAYHGVKRTVRLHERNADARHIFENADGVYIAGGNTFELVLNTFALRNTDGSLVDRRPQANPEPIDGYLREMVEKGLVIVGVSAGLMIMGKDIRTCSDPRSFVRNDGSIATTGLDLLPFNFHPHYEPENVGMKEELEEYPKVDPGVRIIALQNNSFIAVKGKQMIFHGVGGALFESDKPSQHILSGANLGPLLK